MVKKIPLGSKKYPNLYTLVDDEDYEYLSFGNWHPNKTQCTGRDDFYATGHNIGSMHRFIVFVGMGIDIEKEDDVDHINGNGLDNRRSNLRVVSHRQNCQNKHTEKTSKYPGVSFMHKRNVWRADINIKYKQIALGTFKSELEAFNAYKKAVHDLGEQVVCELDSSNHERSGDAFKSPTPLLKEAVGKDGV
jgi:hypothetical protein